MGPIPGFHIYFFKVIEYRSPKKVSRKAKIFQESSWKKQNFIWVLKEYKDLQSGQEHAILQASQSREYNSHPLHLWLILTPPPHLGVSFGTTISGKASLHKPGKPLYCTLLQYSVPATIIR